VTQLQQRNLVHIQEAFQQHEEAAAEVSAALNGSISDSENSDSGSENTEQDSDVPETVRQPEPELRREISVSVLDQHMRTAFHPERFLALTLEERSRLLRLGVVVKVEEKVTHLNSIVVRCTPARAWLANSAPLCIQAGVSFDVQLAALWPERDRLSRQLDTHKIQLRAFPGTKYCIAQREVAGTVSVSQPSGGRLKAATYKWGRSLKGLSPPDQSWVAGLALTSSSMTAPQVRMCTRLVPASHQKTGQLTLSGTTLMRSQLQPGKLPAVQFKN